MRREARTLASRRVGRPARSGRVVTVLVIAVVAVQLAVAPVTLALAVTFVVAVALTRWRSTWLFSTAVVGLVWVTAIGAGPAWNGYVARAQSLIALSRAPGLLTGHLEAAGAALGQWQHWLPWQLPIALIVASAEAGVVCRLTRRTASRPGLIVAARRCYVRASLRRGVVATANGACLGVMTETGKRVSVSWREAAGGVLVTGQDAGAVAGTGLGLAIAAILHRKTVIIVDLAGGAVGFTGGLTLEPMGECAADLRVLRRVTAASERVGAPLAVFGSGGYAYQPFADARGDAVADLLMSMTDWSGVPGARRAFCADYVATAVEVVAKPAAASAQQRNILDELIELLEPGGLEARAGRSDPQLRRRAAALGSQLHADPSATNAITEQLAWLRRSAAWTALCETSDVAKTIDIGLALARRQVVVFPLDPDKLGPAGAMIARLVLADVARVLAERSGAPADCVLWVNGYECLGATPIEAVIAHGAGSGVATIAATAAGAAAARLAGQVGVEVRLDDRADALSVLVRGPAPRLLHGCRVVR